MNSTSTTTVEICQFCPMKKFLTIFLILFTVACNTSTEVDENPPTRPYKNIRGEAQGTTYSITYVGDSIDRQTAIDSMLALYDQDLSLWVEGSLINSVNEFDRTDTVFTFYDQSRFFFPTVFEISREIWMRTDGAFDPTVYPLVELWGFGLKNRTVVNQERVDSALQYVGFEPAKIDMLDLLEDNRYKETQIRKGAAGVKLDFNAIAQGYSVDRIAGMLTDWGYSDFMIEIGGELLCKGLNPQSKPWTIGIDKPEQSADRESFQAIIQPGNRALATSGSYRKFYEENGKKYSHAINPKTGYPVDHNVLSVTVLANTCAEADAYATAFLVMGLEGINEFLSSHAELGLEVYVIFDSGNGTLETLVSPGFEALLVK